VRFEFATAARIIFGPGTVRELAAAAAPLGRQALLAVGKSAERTSAVVSELEGAGIRVTRFHVSGEPTAELVQEGVEQARTLKTDLVISIGGGSAIDTGKAIAALLPNPGGILDYLEVVGAGQALPVASIPFIAVPTTAGTGSEVTRNAVLTVTEQRVKASLRGPTLLPRLAIVDPELTYGVPPDVTAASGLDALVQLIEPFASTGANAMTDALCRDGLRRAARSIRMVYEHPDNASARADMSLAALYSGMALANARLGAVHGFAGPIGGLFQAPHGAICGRLLPPVMELNVRLLRQRAAESEALRRYDEVGQLLTNHADARGDDGAKWIQELCADLHIPALGAYGMTEADLPDVVERSARSSSMKGNPVALTETEMMDILRAAL
jgi:alcohol dehydrogenase class IV